MTEELESRTAGREEKVRNAIIPTPNETSFHGLSIGHQIRFFLSCKTYVFPRRNFIQQLFSIVFAMRVASVNNGVVIEKKGKVQALRLCTGRTAHSGIRGIDLPFLDHGTRRG